MRNTAMAESFSMMYGGRCACGAQLLTGDVDGMCSQCRNHLQQSRNTGIDYGMQSGWKCPQCGKVWAPWVSGCYHCNNLI